MTAVRELYDDDGQYLGKERLDEPDAHSPQERSFEEFWAQFAPDAPGELVDIFGVLIEVPRDMPLSVSVEAEKRGESTSITDIQHMVGLIFNADVLDEWIAKGLNGRQFEVILAWGMANGSGEQTSFAEAARIVAEANAAKDREGKAPARVTPMNRAERRAAERKPGYRSSAAGR